jgi:hypothetical protein
LAAENRAKEALAAAQSVAVDLGRIAEIQESRQVSNESKQALRVGFASSPVIMGRTGWVVRNDSDAPVSKLQISEVNGSHIVVYNNDLDRVERFEIPLLAPGEATRMFRAATVDTDSDDEVEQLRLAFNDAEDRRWERTGTQAPRKADAPN